MGIDVEDIRKLNTELAFVVEALLKGDTVYVWTGKGVHNGWCTTTQVHTYNNADDYYVGEEAPADKE